MSLKLFTVVVDAVETGVLGASDNNFPSVFTDTCLMIVPVMRFRSPKFGKKRKHLSNFPTVTPRRSANIVSKETSELRSSLFEFSQESAELRVKHFLSSLFIRRTTCSRSEGLEFRIGNWPINAMCSLQSTYVELCWPSGFLRTVISN